MASPAQPLALSATYLALLQARQAPPPAPRGGNGAANANAPTSSEQPAAPLGQGRGRLIDIVV
ncbi:MAG TPA: hypothetical protein VLX85_06540 [Stellaceae bacterium]|nr:hypothetical protein [Stellaceae bacterium]